MALEGSQNEIVSISYFHFFPVVSFRLSYGDLTVTVRGIQDTAGSPEDQWLSDQHRVPGVILYTTGHHGRDEDLVRKQTRRGGNQVQGMLYIVKNIYRFCLTNGYCVSIVCFC